MENKKIRIAITAVLGLLVLVGLVLLGYIGLKCKMVDTGVRAYTPDKIEQYVPITGLGIDESSISDDEYSATLEDALKNPNYEANGEEEYRRSVDEILMKFENEDYTSIQFISYKNHDEASITFAKFKTKTIDGQKAYVFLTEEHETVVRDCPYQKDSLALVKTQLTLSDFMQTLNIAPETTRFICGAAHDKDIYSLKIEGQEPDDVIYCEIVGKPFYLWYYTNLKSDKAGASLSFELEK